jgi:hypothetical protein
MSILEESKMAEYVYNEIQLVQPGAPALLDDGIRCNRGLVLHRPGSGILRLRAPGGGCQQFARYRVSFDGNIAVPADGAAGEIQLALAIDGEIVPTSIAAATPTVVDAYWNVSGFAIVDVPACCCYTVSVRNASVSADPATTPAPALNLRNLNVEVTRIA